MKHGGSADLGTLYSASSGYYNAQTGDFDGAAGKAGDVWLIGDHEYAIDNVSGSTGSRSVTVNNPWNEKSAGQTTLSEAALQKLFGYGAAYTE